MAPLKFCANLSWLFTELPDLSRRLQAAAAAGFQAVEAAWILDSNLQELQRVKESAGVELVLLNTPPGESRRSRTHLRDREALMGFWCVQETWRPGIWVWERFPAERRSSDAVWSRLWTLLKLWTVRGEEKMMPAAQTLNETTGSNSANPHVEAWQKLNAT